MQVMSACLCPVRRYLTYPGSRRRRTRVTRSREPEAVRTVERDHRRVQRDPDSRSLLKGVRSLGNNPRKVSVHFNILGEAAPFLVNAATKGSCDLIADIHRNTKVGSSLHDDPREVASEDCPRVSVTPGICDCEGQ
jgi:hypothetical protein